MNILHLSAVKNWGGGEKHLENLCEELGEIAPHVNNYILCIKNGFLHKRLKSKNYKNLIPSVLLFKVDPFFFLRINNVCKEKKIDLIHIHDSTALSLAVMGDHLGDLPPFIFSKKTSFPIRKRRLTLYKYNYPKLKKILCVSEASKSIAEKGIRNKDSLLRVYHGTGLKDKILSSNFSLRKKLNLKDGDFIVGNIANHQWPKDLSVLVHLANEVVNNQKIEDIHFIQIGEFSRLTPSLQNLVKKFQLENKFSFLNGMPEAATLIPQFDVSVMTSESEGIPQFIYESFYYKVPVVSTDAGGIPEIIEHGKNGLLAPVKDYKKLAEHVLKLKNNPVLREHFTGFSSNLIMGKFNSHEMAKQTFTTYKEVLNGRS